jgi:hypothetical protein
MNGKIVELAVTAAHGPPAVAEAAPQLEPYLVSHAEDTHNSTREIVPVQLRSGQVTFKYPLALPGTSASTI